MMRFRRVAIVFGLLAACSTAVLAGESRDTIVLSGNPRVDLFGFRSLTPELPPMQDQEHGPIPTEKKSPYIAAGLSVILPGAGEFYSESYLKSGLFLLAEVALWGIAYSYDHRGDKATDGFNNFADTHWSVVEYIKYTQKNFLTGSTYNVWKTGAVPASNAPDPWNYVNWDVLNQMEHDAAATGNGTFYSHTLPVHGDQQYYEEIGKYEQYNSGWDDIVPLNLAPDYSVIKANESPRGNDYMAQRAQANSYYKNASTFVALAIVNHLVSAIDAAITAGSYNRNLHAEVGLRNIPNGGSVAQVPVVKLSYTVW
jgi:hypothetical protein